MSESTAISQALLANHKFLGHFEYVKERTERIIDELPDVFVIIDRNGLILKGNNAAASFFGVDIEDLLFLNFSKLFQEETWKVFEAKMDILIGGLGKDRIVELESPVKLDNDAGTLDFHWNIRIFETRREFKEQLFAVQGRDISRLREYEKQISHIFSYVPLGILTVSNKGMIEVPYSNYLEYLLGEVDLGGKPFFDAAIKPAWETMDEKAKEGAKYLLECFGQTKEWFHSIEADIPTEIYYPPNTISNVDSRWLGFTYHPVIYNHKIDQLLVVVQNRTDKVMAHLEKSKLTRLSYIDSLTGIPNRRNFDQTFEKEWRRCARKRESIAVIMIDVDYFKLYNDNYGHQRGDQCLKEVAEAVNAAVRRPSDFVGRYGGEEFVVMLPGSNQDGAMRVAENIRKSVESRKIVHDYSKVSKYVTISLGIAIIEATQGQESEKNKLVAQADKGLYIAKNSGKNTVAFAEWE